MGQTNLKRFIDSWDMIQGPLYMFRVSHCTTLQPAFLQVPKAEMPKVEVPKNSDSTVHAACGTGLRGEALSSLGIAAHLDSFGDPRDIKIRTERSFITWRRCAGLEMSRVRN